MKGRLTGISNWWKRVRTTSRFHNILLYIAFVAIAAVFWLALALNDRAQHTFDVGIRINDVPDSIMFVSDIPDNFHVTVHDKSTSLLRNAVLKQPAININFKDYANANVLLIRNNDLLALIRKAFGTTAQVTSISLDSLKLVYTDKPGKRVPIVVLSDVKAESGYVTGPRPILSQGYTLIYGSPEITDTITRVYTQRIVRRGVSESITTDVLLQTIPGVRMIPSKVKVTIPVEPLVNKREQVNVTVINTPEEMSVLLFPQKVEVSYYVPMSRFNDPQQEIKVVADYASRGLGISGRIPVKVQSGSSQCVNLTVMTDSLEYTIVK